MVLTPSTMRLSLGENAPDFSLPDPSGSVHSLADSAGKPALLVAFFCNHCPYVKHVASGFAQLAKEYQQRGLAVVAINSNDFERYPDDSPAKMQDEIELRGYTFPYVIDESQEVANAFHACLHFACLSLRCPAEAGLPRPVGRQPPGKHTAGHRRRPPRCARCRASRSRRRQNSEAQHGLPSIKWRPETILPSNVRRTMVDPNQES